MKPAKQILRQELYVALLEFTTGGGNSPEKTFLWCGQQPAHACGYTASTIWLLALSHF